MRRRPFLAVSVLATTPLLGLALGAPAGASNGSVPVAPPGPATAGVTASSSVGLADDVAAYWTPERMRSAKPADVVRGATRLTGSSSRTAPAGDRGGPVDVQPVRPLAMTGTTSLSATVPTTAGKLFTTDAKGGNWVCSASTVNNGKKNLVVTAAHCVHDGKGGTWHHNIAFVPAYSNGSRPYGTWSWTGARTFTSWINDSNFSQDQAFVTMAPLNGRNIVDVVGGNGIVWGNSKNQPSTRIWGWPAEAPYTGQTAYYCDGNTTSYVWSSDARMACDMTGGASGGPWLKDRIDANLGYTFAVTSRRTTSGTPTLMATPFDNNTYSLFTQM